MIRFKIYYVSIYGRENSFWGFHGHQVHRELVITTSHAKAKEDAWNNLRCDMSDLWKAITTRRDFKIESEDVTGYWKAEEQESTYWTIEDLRK